MYQNQQRQVNDYQSTDSFGSSIVGRSQIFESKLGPSQYELTQSPFDTQAFRRDQLIEGNDLWRKACAGLFSIATFAACSAFYFWLIQSSTVGIWVH